VDSNNVFWRAGGFEGLPVIRLQINEPSVARLMDWEFTLRSLNEMNEDRSKPTQLSTRMDICIVILNIT
jgi:hypothetical protein